MNKIVLSLVILMPTSYLFSQKAQLIPLSIGNYWKYEDHGFQYSQEIKKDSVVKGIKWYFMAYENSWYANLNDGVYINLLGNPGRPLYVYPSSVGYWYKDYFSDSVVVLSRDTTITVKQGTHNCYLYRRFPSTDEYSDYIYYDVYCSPEVGTVKVERYEKKNGKIYQSSHIELLECNIKK